MYNMLLTAAVIAALYLHLGSCYDSFVANSLNTPPGTRPLTGGNDELEARQCAGAVDSTLVNGGTSTPQSKTAGADTGASDEFIAALNGVWTSMRCEIAPGPEFTYRRYFFYASPREEPFIANPASRQYSSRVLFRSFHFKFADSACLIPVFAYSSEGELTVIQPLSRLYSQTPGGEEAEVTVYRVSLSIFNATAFIAGNYSAFSLQNTNRVTELGTKVKSRTEIQRITSTEIFKDSGENKATKVKPSCSVERLWPDLAKQLYSNLTPNVDNRLMFEVYNDLELYPNRPVLPRSPPNRGPAIADEWRLNDERLGCLKKEGLGVDELQLIRIETRNIYARSTATTSPNDQLVDISVLKTGQIYHGILGQKNYKPAKYGSNLLYRYRPFIDSICPVCKALSRSDIEENFFEKFISNIQSLSSESPPARVTISDVNSLLPNLLPQPLDSGFSYDGVLKKSGRWTSTRCETRSYGIFLMRQIVFSRQSPAVFYSLQLFFQDPLCTIPTYDVEFGGDFRRLRGVFTAKPRFFSGISQTNKTRRQQRPTSPFAESYLFNTNWARIRPRNFQAVSTLSEFSHAGNCGSSMRWRLGEWQDVSQTGGCRAISINIPEEELQIIRLEIAGSGDNKAHFLYVGDALSKRPLYPSLMTSIQMATPGSREEQPSAENFKNLDYSLFEQIRPTSFLEPLIYCRDLVNIHTRYVAMTPRLAPTTLKTELQPWPTTKPAIPAAGEPINFSSAFDGASRNSESDTYIQEAADAQLHDSSCPGSVARLLSLSVTLLLVLIKPTILLL